MRKHTTWRACIKWLVIIVHRRLLPNSYAENVCVEIIKADAPVTSSLS